MRTCAQSEALDTFLRRRRTVQDVIPPTGVNARGRRVARGIVVLLLGMLPSSPVAAGVTSRVSISSQGTEANGGSSAPAVSRAARLVAFASDAANLVTGDTNSTTDVFVRERETNVTERVSVASDGSQGNGASLDPAVSANGRFVAFTSLASDMVPGDTNDASDVFVRDRRTGTTERVSVASDGTEGTVGPQLAIGSVRPAISADGRFVAFVSDASGLTPETPPQCVLYQGPLGTITGNCTQVFVHDRASAVTERASVASDGTGADTDSSRFDRPALSASGRQVAFQSAADNLVADGLGAGVFVRDRRAGTTTRASGDFDGLQGDIHSSSPALSARGRFVAFVVTAFNLMPGDAMICEPVGSNPSVCGDVYVYDRRKGTSECVSVDDNGVPGNRSSSELDTPSISGSGRYIAFSSTASNLVPGDTNVCAVPGFAGSGPCADVFVHDRKTGTTERVSVATDGSQASGSSSAPSIASSGKVVAFASFADDLVPGDTNTTSDIFVRTR